MALLTILLLCALATFISARPIPGSTLTTLGFLPSLHDSPSSFTTASRLRAPGSAAKILAMTDLKRQTQSHLSSPLYALMPIHSHVHGRSNHHTHGRKREQRDRGLDAHIWRENVLPVYDLSARPALNPDAVSDDEYELARKYKASFLEGYYARQETIPDGRGGPYGPEN